MSPRSKQAESGGAAQRPRPKRTHPLGRVGMTLVPPTYVRAAFADGEQYRGLCSVPLSARGIAGGDWAQADALRELASQDRVQADIAAITVHGQVNAVRRGGITLKSVIEFESWILGVRVAPSRLHRAQEIYRQPSAPFTSSAAKPPRRAEEQAQASDDANETRPFIGDLHLATST